MSITFASVGCAMFNRTDQTLLSPLSVVGITVALKLWVGAALVDSTAAHLDLSEGPSPVIMADIITTNPITKWSPVWFYKACQVINKLRCCTHARTRAWINLTYWVC